MDGPGQLAFASGVTFSGDYSQGARPRVGKLTFADRADVYEGEVDGAGSTRAGQGRCTYANGDVYEGQWREDKRSGRGWVQFKDSSFYEGEFVADMMEGQGKYRFSHGDVFEGNESASRLY